MSPEKSLHGSTHGSVIPSKEEPPWYIYNLVMKKSTIKSNHSNSYQDTSVFMSLETDTIMLVTAETLENGISFVVKDHGKSHLLLIVKETIAQLLQKVMIVSFFMKNVTTEVWVLVFVLTLLSLMLIMKSNPSKSQNLRQFISITYHVSKDKTLNSANQLNV